MKTLKNLFAMLVMASTVISCSGSSDTNTTKVKYQIGGIDNFITQIKYTNGNVSTVTVTNINNFGGGTDTKITSVNRPFIANLEVTVNNTSSSSKYYTLSIYVDDILYKAVGLTVPPNAISTGVANYIVN